MRRTCPPIPTDPMLNHPMPSVWSFGYHTVTLWSFSRTSCEQAKARIIRDWSFAHSPSEAVSPIAEISFSEVQPDWLHADTHH